MAVRILKLEGGHAPRPLWQALRAAARNRRPVRGSLQLREGEIHAADDDGEVLERGVIRGERTWIRPAGHIELHDLDGLVAQLERMAQGTAAHAHLALEARAGEMLARYVPGTEGRGVEFRQPRRVGRRDTEAGDAADTYAGVAAAP